MKKKITDTIDAKILVVLHENYGDDADRNAECMLEIKKLLQEEQEKIVKKIEGMKKDLSEYTLPMTPSAWMDSGFNEALDDLIRLIQEEI